MIESMLREKKEKFLALSIANQNLNEKIEKV